MIAIFNRYNKFLVLLSVAASIVFGVLTPSIFSNIKFLGDLFINLLKLFALPLICSALIAALGGLSGNISKLKALSKKTVGYMLFSEIIAVVIALGLFNVLKPGAGGNPDLILNGQPYEASGHQAFGFSQFILSIFPDNVFYSLTNFELLPVVVLSILF